MNKKYFLGFLFYSFLVLPKFCLAVCPVCIIAVGTCVGLSRWLGVDDTISGLWIGGLLAAISLWTIGWLDKRKINFRGRTIAVFLIYYFLAISSSHLTKIAGHSFNKLFGVDKLILGIIMGSFGMLGANFLHKFLKNKNKGHSFFPFQKVLLPIAVLLILSAIFYFLTC